MRVVVVGSVVGGVEPSGLAVGDAAEVSGLGGADLLLLALNLADNQAAVLGLDEDLVAMETEENGGGVLAGCMLAHVHT